ncbi:uncharacterized protein LOC129963844 [Argiope bruennichi]|uniref:Cuticle protein 16.8 like protein n=1 Tax=Argiope bruennichi TaxID=94029 RepID=A0A8T0EXJ9_ARGBR|nr:uncharacterized protein LOC129963844 [Argiope bruennichi]KAF8782297.1 Cuticle protein 16.8 like protein [Argiope bruennichi]
MFAKSLLCLVLIGCALAQDYSDDQAAREQQLSPNYARQSYNADYYETARAEPYDFGFQSTDEFGTIMNRQESSDNNGAVRGSYGYTDPFGVFRHVDYVADEYGFRAEVKSNEPGMGTQSPANVQIYAEPPPAGVIVERPYYHPHAHAHGQGSQSGQASGQQASRRNPSSSASTNANRQVRPVSSGARFASTSSATRTSVYPYVQPQQNAFSNNALSGNQYATSNSNQYPSTVSSQYAANAAAAAASNSASSGSQYATGTTYQASAASVYPARNPYGSQGYAGLATSHLASGRSASTEQPIVPRPYDGPTYKIGNPHVTEFTKADKEKSGTYLLPTVVTAGGAPTTLVKHIHTYPAAPVA